MVDIDQCLLEMCVICTKCELVCHKKWLIIIMAGSSNKWILSVDRALSATGLVVVSVNGYVFEIHFKDIPFRAYFNSFICCDSA